MALGKVQGTITWGETNQGPIGADDPSVVVYEDGRLIFKYYATRFLGLTAVADSEILQRVREAAETLGGEPQAAWTKADAEVMLAAGGVMPAPTHAQVALHPVQPLLLVRAAAPGGKDIRTLSYARRSTRPVLAASRHLKRAGIKVPPGTRLEMPVTLMEDDQGRLVVAVLLDRSETRPLDEVERKGSQGQPD